MNWRAIAMAVVAIFVLAAVVYFLVRRGQQRARQGREATPGEEPGGEDLQGHAQDAG